MRMLSHDLVDDGPCRSCLAFEIRRPLEDIDLVLLPTAHACLTDGGARLSGMCANHLLKPVLCQSIERKVVTVRGCHPV